MLAKRFYRYEFASEGVFQNEWFDDFTDILFIKGLMSEFYEFFHELPCPDRKDIPQGKFFFTEFGFNHFSRMIELFENGYNEVAENYPDIIGFKAIEIVVDETELSHVTQLDDYQVVLDYDIILAKLYQKSL